VFTALYLYTFGNWLAFAFYGIFFSALLVAVRTDLEELVIPQLVSLWLIPLGIFGAWFNISEVSLTESVLGAVLGYGVLWSVGAVYTFFTKREGIGTGDMELLGMIGSFIGLLGAWFSLLIGSITGLFIGTAYLLIMGKNSDTKIPFGPFLILGATLYFFYKTFLLAAIS
jgi:Type IV leader peptidase family.